MRKFSSCSNVAVIGMGCRFPGGVNSPFDLWNILISGKDCITDVPANRWSIQQHYGATPLKKGKTNVCKGGFIDKYDEFDASFFGMSPREAAALDPQQRQLLMVSWEALEDASLRPDSLRKSQTGVYIGGFTLDYMVTQFASGSLENISSHTAVGSMMTMLSNRISYFFDFVGPSMSIDTACSSSLVAVDAAFNAIKRGDCSLALAGGVLLNFAPQFTIAESQGGFLSPDGLSKAFDSSANGYVRGEGVGIVVLKSLDKALADGDRIYAVIRGSAVTHDGKTNGITVPNGNAQEAAIRLALKNANCTPLDIDYVEAHGTGTPVGDPIEANAIGNVFSEGRNEDNPLIIGSIKTNIGHTESAAGIAGLMKTALALYHGQIPAHLHLKQVNPKIDIATLKVSIPKKTTQWGRGNRKRMAGVNSFGFGGTNAHVILEEAPITDLSPSTDGECPEFGWPFLLSAVTESKLADQANAWLDHLERYPSISVRHATYASFMFKSPLARRSVFSVNKKSQLLNELKKISEGATEETHFGVNAIGEGRDPVWVFTGMGPQWWGMGRELLETDSLFRKTMEECDRYFVAVAGWSILEQFEVPEVESRMAETEVSQPANFFLQASLIETWRRRGIRPGAIVGHSTGEVASLYAAGVYTLEEAVKIVYYRSNLQRQCAGTGSMLAVGLTEDEARDSLIGKDGLVEVAAVNGPSMITLSGDKQILESLSEEFQDKGKFCKFLKVDIPFHSPVLDPIKDQIIRVLGFLKPRKPKLPLYSTVTGKKVDGPIGNNEYWWANIRGTVRFMDAIENILVDGHRVFIEMGPHPVLAASLKEIFQKNAVEAVCIKSLHRKEPEAICLRRNQDMVIALGCGWDPQCIFDDLHLKIQVPKYRWSLNRYWSEPEESMLVRAGSPSVWDGVEISRDPPVWQIQVNTVLEPFLLDHKIQGTILFPAAGHVELMAQMVCRSFGKGRFELTDIEFRKAQFLPDDRWLSFRIGMDISGALISIQAYGEQGTSQGELAFGKFRTIQAPFSGISLPAPEFLENAIQHSKQEFYEQCAVCGFNYGPAFQTLDRIQVVGNCILAKLELPMGQSLTGHVIHPALLDGCFQAFLAKELLDEIGSGGYKQRLPVGINCFKMYGPLDGELTIKAEIQSEDSQSASGSIEVFSSANGLVLSIEGFSIRTLESMDSKVSLQTLDSWLYHLEWQSFKFSPEPTESQSSWLLIDYDGELEPITAALSDDFNVHHIKMRIRDSQSLNLLEGDEFLTIFESMASEGKPWNIVFGLALQLAWNIDFTMENLTRPVSQVFTPLMNILRALQNSGLKAKVHIVTEHAISVHGEVPNPFQASLWGPARIIGNQEMVPFWGGIWDVDRTYESWKCLVEMIKNETSEDQIALRNGRIFVARLKNISTPILTPSLRVYADRPYLITGAFGALGTLTIEHLIDKGARTLWLITHSPLPDYDTAHTLPPGNSLRERVMLVEKWKEKGVSINVASVDTGNVVEFREFLSDWVLGPGKNVAGVIHAAGIVKDQLLTEMSPETFLAVWKPKVIGAYILDAMLSDCDLDFFIMYSSIASTVVSAGQFNYSAANSFLDTLCLKRWNEGRTALAIGWGPWAVGMIKEHNLEELYRKRGMDVILPRQGMQVLDRLASLNEPIVGVVSARWTQVIESGPRSTTPYLEPLRQRELGSVNVKSDIELRHQFEQQMNSLLINEREPILIKVVIDILARVLRIDPGSMDPNESPNAYGFDSMMATEFRNRLELQTGVSLPMVEILSGKPLCELAMLVGMKWAEGSASLNSEAEGVGLDNLVGSIDEATLKGLLEKVNELSDEDAARLLKV